jgi:vacuolar-type H+-ATPase subunit H
MVVQDSETLFGRTIGGYDPTEAERVIAELRSTVSAVESSLNKIDSESRRLERKLQERKVSRPQFADLGPAFESAINLAEEQALSLITDALSETRDQVAHANTSSKSRISESKKQALAAIADANDKAKRIVEKAERDASRQREQTKVNLATVAQERDRADKLAAAVLADAESQVAELRLRMNEEIDRDRTSTEEGLRVATEQTAKINEEIRVLSEKAEKEIAAILDEAEKYSAQTRSEADQHAESSYKGADEYAMVETHKYLEATRARAAKALDEARSRAEQALIGAEKITGEITASSQDFVANLARDLEARLDKARRNLDDISGFLYTIRSMTNGFDLGELSVARSRVASDLSNSSVAVAELLDD